MKKKRGSNSFFENRIVAIILGIAIIFYFLNKYYLKLEGIFNLIEYIIVILAVAWLFIKYFIKNDKKKDNR